MPIGIKTGKPINFSESISTSKIIDVPQIAQEQTNWCWAACTEMVLRYSGELAVQQCELANELFGRFDCCSEPSNPECNKPCEIEDISTLYSRKNIQSQFVDKNVPFSTLQSEIDADRPVEIVFYQRKEQRGHLVIVRGWHTIEAEEFVHVNDPKDSTSASRIVAYSELLDAYGEGKWFYTWVRIRKRGKENGSRWKVTR